MHAISLTPESFTPERVQRYNRPTPRYTSYPTAPHFSDAFGPEDYAAALGRAREAMPGRDLSVYVHVPFCRRLCWYCGCHTVISRSAHVLPRYLAALDREMGLVAGHLGSGRRVRQVHWGGGTPTYLAPEQITALADGIRRHFVLDDGADMSLEADPRGLTRAHLEAARAAGFRRISFGVQDFDPHVQEAINRVQPVELVARVTAWAREVGFEGVNYDLVYGLPYQTPASYERTLDLVQDLGPDRLSVFSYAHVPWLKVHQRLIPDEALPDGAAKLALFLRIIERLTAAGYRHVGMDHFARPEDPLCQAQDAGRLHRNFQGYDVRGDLDVLAFGASGIGQVHDVYVQNRKDLPDYYEAVEAGRLPVQRGIRLTEDDQRRRHAIVRLMCDFRLDWARLGAELGLDDARVYFADALVRLETPARDGLVELREDGLVVTDVGRLFVRTIAAAFDAYLAPGAASPQRMYSKAV
ncbi:MAG: oxygen-independent coproporphyrinogen III oxidase [Bacteroidetes bacterium]|nr:MAG: oxygen-independent coproporphyrinogen III oxidase [Bacteroidota bacterium]